MSAEIVLRDIEMVVILKALRETQAVAATDLAYWDVFEPEAAERARQKIEAGLNRPSRRRRQT